MNGQKIQMTFLAILCFCINIGAQNYYPIRYQCIYYCKWSTDSTAITYIEDTLVLNISTSINTFHKATYLLPDTVLTKQNSVDTIQSRYSFNTDKVALDDYLIINNSSKTIITITHHDHLFQEAHKVVPKWKIRDSVKVIKGYVSALAECEQDGNKWFAWFSPTIPVFAGPWKLFGLPGLIIQAYDIENNHLFELISIETPKDSLLSVPFFN